MYLSTFCVTFSQAGPVRLPNCDAAGDGGGRRPRAVRALQGEPAHLRAGLAHPRPGGAARRYPPRGEQDGQGSVLVIME